MRRKIYEQLLNWKKNDADKTALLLEGARRVGKSYIVKEFAEKLLSKCGNVMVVVFDWPAHGDDIRKRMTLAECCDYLELVTREEALSVFGF